MPRAPKFGLVASVNTFISNVECCPGWSIVFGPLRVQGKLRRMLLSVPLWHFSTSWIEFWILVSEFWFLISDFKYRVNYSLKIRYSIVIYRKSELDYFHFVVFWVLESGKQVGRKASWLLGPFQAFRTCPRISLLQVITYLQRLLQNLLTALSHEYTVKVPHHALCLLRYPFLRIMVRWYGLFVVQ